MYTAGFFATKIPLEGTCLLLTVLTENRSFKTDRATPSEDILLSGIGPAGFC